MTQMVPIYDIWRILSYPRDHVEAEIRALCRTAYLGDHTALCRMLGRYKMYVDTRDVGIASHLMLEGYWEMWVTAAMMQCIRRGSVVADVGANLGYFTLLMADLTGAEGRVLSFEPNHNLASRVRKSIAVNGFGGFTDFHQVALGEADGEVEMEIDESMPGGGRALHEKTKASPASSAPPAPVMSSTEYYAGKPGKKAKPAPLIKPTLPVVPVRRFDEIDHALDVEFMKIDVEGFEPYVWAGMTGLLKRGRPLTIFMEFTIERFPDAKAFLQEILSFGFSLEIVDLHSGIQPITAEQLFAGPHNIDHMLVFRRY
jgi:FkbM family methyltransferase